MHARLFTSNQDHSECLASDENVGGLQELSWSVTVTEVLCDEHTHTYEAVSIEFRIAGDRFDFLEIIR